MDTLNHSVQGFILGYAVTGNIPIGIASGVISTVPDLYGEWKARKGDWTWYEDIHDFKNLLCLFPPITLHVALDKLGHGEGKRWYIGKWYEYFNPFKWKESMYLESITWLINIIILLWLFV